MSEYQLELKQIVDYPRCRIYRQFVQSLITDRNIRASRGSGLFYYTVLSCYRETSGVGKRKLLTMDEVLRLPITKALIIIRGRKVLQVDKYDYTCHPEAERLLTCKASEHMECQNTRRAMTYEKEFDSS